MQFCLKKLIAEQMEFHLSEKLQIYQCFIHFSIYFPKSNCFQILPPDVLDDCHRKWVAAQSNYELETAIDDIMPFLERQGYPCSEEHSIEGGVFQFATVTNNGVQYVVECLNDDIRFRNQPMKLIGKTIWRENILTRLGYFLLRIDPHEWAFLQTDEERLKFFKRII